MSKSDIIAVIGALAWLPHILYLFRDYFSQSKILVIPEKKVEIGFTNYGPIFNLKLALGVDNKKAVIDDITVLLNGPDGANHTFSWRGGNEEIKTIKDTQGNVQASEEKNFNPIAIFLQSTLSKELFVRFTDKNFDDVTNPKMITLTDQLNFFKQSCPTEYIDKTLKSKELVDYKDAFKNYFFWRKGLYQFSFEISCKNKFKFLKESYSFELRDEDVARLKCNENVVDEFFDSLIKSNDPSFQMFIPNWSWINAKIFKSE
jgi:hypothetical protein